MGDKIHRIWLTLHDLKDDTNEDHEQNDQVYNRVFHVYFSLQRLPIFPLYEFVQVDLLPLCTISQPHTIHLAPMTDMHFKKKSLRNGIAKTTKNKTPMQPTPVA